MLLYAFDVTSETGWDTPRTQAATDGRILADYPWITPTA